MKRIHFFATPLDLPPVLFRLEDKIQLKFVEYGNFTTPNVASYESSKDIPELGISTSESGGGSTKYLVTKRQDKLNFDHFISSSGIARWSVDNASNEGSVTFTPAGLWGSEILLAGLIDTLHETPEAQSIMRGFLSAMKKEGFININGWWLGNEALKMLQAGCRLATTAVQSSPDFDLPLPDEYRV